MDADSSTRRSFIQGFIDDLPDAFLRCRELGHNWSPHTAGRYKDGGFTRTLRCPRCRTKKVQDLSRTGMILSNRYIHPEGYLIEGVGQLVGEERGSLRLESVTRIIEKSEQKANNHGS